MPPFIIRPSNSSRASSVVYHRYYYIECLTTVSRLLLRLHDGKGLPLGLGWIFGQFLCNFHKERLDVVGIFGRRFQMQNSVFFGVRVGLFEFDFAATLQIGLVSRQSDYDIGVAASLQFLDPALGASEAVGIGDIVYDNRGGGPTVVHGSEGAITFLTRRIPV